MEKVDYLIVGQGVAGSLLAHFLLKNNQKIAIVDNENIFASSTVAAGIINPITGRNFVKTWLADETIAQSIQFYSELSPDFYQNLPLVWLLENIKQANDWEILSANPQVNYFINTDKKLANDLVKSYFNEVVDNVILAQSGKINLNKVLNYFKNILSQGLYLAEKFDFKQLIVKDSVYYKQIVADKIVFCEGYQAAENIFFNDLHYKFAKGEVMIARILDYQFADYIIKHKGLLIAPLEDNLYWVGSSYDRDFAHVLPTAAAYNNLKSEFEQIYTGKYEIFSYLAGVRPTVRDRKPYLGQHKTAQKVYIFNGLGAKGSYLAPYFAQLMCDYLLGKAALPKDIDIWRIYKKRN